MWAVAWSRRNTLLDAASPISNWLYTLTVVHSMVTSTPWVSSAALTGFIILLSPEGDETTSLRHPKGKASYRSPLSNGSSRTVRTMLPSCYTCTNRRLNASAYAFPYPSVLHSSIICILHSGFAFQLNIFNLYQESQSQGSEPGVRARVRQLLPHPPFLVSEPEILSVASTHKCAPHGVCPHEQVGRATLETHERTQALFPQHPFQFYFLSEYKKNSSLLYKNRTALCYPAISCDAGCIFQDDNQDGEPPPKSKYDYTILVSYGTKLRITDSLRPY
ncbi:hypothetical protein Vafri_16779 [Volvox africanus]|uniref:Uncharacterized protein n=1 Tax=Volvox africanus TaxID=51714 RepID=A0A8J4BIW5_9CHLO|nr:hypothetical protein Vafri_16779 [Volvox africanus]